MSLLARAARWVVLACIAPTILIVAGIAADYSSFDSTQGGYEAPYTGWTGTPVNFDAAYRGEEGFYKRGYIVDFKLNCTTGMVTFIALNLVSFDWQVVSARALKVHKPRESCIKHGYAPTF